MAEVLHRAVWSHVAAPTEPMILPRGSRRWRVGLIDLDDAVTGLRQREVRYAAGRAMLGQRDLAPGAGPDGGGRGVPRRPDPGRGGPEPPRTGVGRPALARARPGQGGVPAARRRAVAGGGLGRDPRRRRAGATRLVADPARAGAGAVDRRRRGPDRRGDRSAPPHRQRRPRRAGRGAGPLPHAAARGRPPVLDRVGDAARRPRAGHHPVVDDLVGDLAGAPRQGRRRGRRAHCRLPRPGRRHRVRRQAAPDDRSRPRPTHVDPHRRRRPHGAPGRGRQRRRRLRGTDRPGRAWARSASSCRTHSSRRRRAPSTRPDSRTRCSAPRTTSTPASTWCRRRWPRAWSSITWWSIEPADIVEAEADERTGLRRLYVCLTRAVSTLTVIHARPLPTRLA